MYNYYVKVAKLFNQYVTDSSFYIKKELGEFKTKRMNGDNNFYSQRYRMYVDNTPIAYGVFYQMDKLASALKIDVREIVKYMEE